MAGRCNRWCQRYEHVKEQEKERGVEEGMRGAGRFMGGRTATREREKRGSERSDVHSSSPMKDSQSAAVLQLRRLPCPAAVGSAQHINAVAAVSQRSIGILNLLPEGLQVLRRSLRLD